MVSPGNCGCSPVLVGVVKAPFDCLRVGRVGSVDDSWGLRDRRCGSILHAQDDEASGDIPSTKTSDFLRSRCDWGCNRGGKRECFGWPRVEWRPVLLEQ